MSEQFDELFNDDEGQEQEPQDGATLPKEFRDYAKRLKTQNKELQDKVAAFETAQRESKLDSFIKEKGLPEKAKALIGDNDPEQWYSEYGDVFATEKPPEDDGKPRGETALPEQEKQEIQGVTNVQPGTFQPGGDAEMNSKLDSIFDGTKSEKEIIAEMKQMGAMT